MATHKIAKFPGYTVNLSIEPETDSIADHFATGDEDTDREIVRQIEDQWNCGNDWAWCLVKIVVTHDKFGLTETEFLGACSYASEDEFVKDAYFDDMTQECVNRMESTIAKIRAA
ncbi:hypothetical protein UFOVP75_10 [uncultured Caudovirales phage]|uniref:Uncharacterized protein n=1 Tax=uncultured Caudovirales phage TaxID=2100421 RepID=A0A6J5KZ53_9CAUD|nr:hypothetical protein UFOVP75_10 [uncultured Caudovirales phage]